LVDRLSVATLLAPQVSVGRFSRRITVGDLATYLGELQPAAVARTLELAKPLPMTATLGEIDLLGGDRLVIFLRLPRETEFAISPSVGDLLLTLTSPQTGYQVASQSKTGLWVGLGEGGRAVPDVDLSQAMSADVLPYISRSTLWLSYENRQWTAARTGQTRVYLDDYEVATQPVPLRDGQRFTFLRAMGDDIPLGSLTISLQRVEHSSTAPPLEAGPEVIPVCVGSEARQQIVRATGSVSVETLAMRLLRANQHAFADDVSVYRLRLLPPNQRLTAVERSSDALLYLRSITSTQKMPLILRDVDAPAHQYPVQPSDEVQAMGTRLQPGATVSSLTIDLFPSFEAGGNLPHQLGLPNPYLAQLIYREAERVWWLSAAVPYSLPLFVNTTRVGAGGVPLVAGDRVTFGDSVEQPLVRLVVEAP
jgi:hypothetical protein